MSGNDLPAQPGALVPAGGHGSAPPAEVPSWANSAGNIMLDGEFGEALANIQRGPMERGPGAISNPADYNRQPFTRMAGKEDWPHIDGFAKAAASYGFSQGDWDMAVKFGLATAAEMFSSGATEAEVAEAWAQHASQAGMGEAKILATIAWYLEASGAGGISVSADRDARGRRIAEIEEIMRTDNDRYWRDEGLRAEYGRLLNGGA